MSDIIFKGKSLEQDTFVFGTLVVCGKTGRAFIVPEGSEVIEDKTDNGKNIIQLTAHEVDPDSLVQCSGEDGADGKKRRATMTDVSGMEVAVAGDSFIIPIMSITQILKLGPGVEVMTDTDGAEMVMVRGATYPIIRLHQIYGIDTKVTDLAEGLLIIVEGGNARACLFTDRLVGEKKVDVVLFPEVFDQFGVEDLGLSGCAILEDGSISMALDISRLLHENDGEEN